MIRALRNFGPRADATPSEVRRTGLRNAFLGLVLFALGYLVVISLDRLTRGAILDPTHPRPSKLRAVSGTPLLLGLLAMTAGLYRAITGVHPDRDGMTLVARTGRVVLAVLLAALIVAAMLTAIVAIAVATHRARGLAP